MKSRLALFAAALSLLVGAAPSKPSAHAASPQFALCSGPHRVTCVVDGDTFWLDGDKIRIADINTPETSTPACADEAALGHRATQRLIELLNAGPFELALWQDRDTDRYGRKLRVVMRGGRSLGAQLTAEGLAETWRGRRGSWCPARGDSGA